MSAPHTPPHLVVVRGEPTAEEIAALTAVLTARAAASAAARTPAPQERASAWRDRARGLRAPLRPGTWRTGLR